MTLKLFMQRAPVTSMLAASFILLFVIQAITGVDVQSPSTMSLVNWGANIFPLTMGEEPWRLFTSAFLHIGIEHLLFNTIAALIFGMTAEFLFGRVYFLAIFLLSAIGGGLLNSYMTWQGLLTGEQYAIAAGASGGIMGLGGALLLAAFCNFPLRGSTLDKRNLVVLMGINLFYGFIAAGIDNAAHIGGALTGVFLAAAYVIAYKWHKQWIRWLAIVLVAVAFIAYWHSLHDDVLQALVRFR